MRVRKLIMIVLTILSLGIISTRPSLAYSEPEHSKIIREVLFGANKYISNTDDLDALNDAVSLTLDQFNGNGGNTLDELRNTFGIKGLPKSISEIDFSSNTHRSYTHQGWNYPYNTDLHLDQRLVNKSNFDLRKTILLNTVNQVFYFSPLSGKLFFSYDAKCEAFAELLYYVHILGDYEEIYANSTSYSERNKMIPLIKGNGQFGLIEELDECFRILFKDQENSRVFNSLVKTEMSRIKNEASKIYTRPEDLIDDPEVYKQYIDLAHELLMCLKEYVPLLLKKESFFTAVF